MAAASCARTTTSGATATRATVHATTRSSHTTWPAHPTRAAHSSARSRARTDEPPRQASYPGLQRVVGSPAGESIGPLELHPAEFMAQHLDEGAVGQRKVGGAGCLRGILHLK